MHPVLSVLIVVVAILVTGGQRAGGTRTFNTVVLLETT